MGVFSSKAVPSSVQSELNARASIQASDAWFASRVNWVHIMSFCDGCSSTNVEQLYSLKSLNIYQDGGTFSGQRPTPIVESIQVKAQGNLGTTRSCTIKIIAFTQAQLDELTACYGIPSMSVRVQFGWNKGANDTSAPSPLIGVMTDNEAIGAINDRRSTFANYDGLQGLVGKWSINFVKESMWWEFTLDLMAASSPVLSRPLEDFTSQCYCDRVAQGSEDTEKVSQGTSALRAKLIQYIEKPDTKEEGVYKIQLNHSERDQLGAYAGGLMGKLASKIGVTLDTKEAYISFGKLQKIVNDYSFSQAAGKSLMAIIDSTTYGTISYKSPGYTSDPDICIYPGIDQPNDGGLDGIKNVPTCKVTDGVDINKVLLNCIFLNKCIEDIGKQGTLQDFFEKVFNGMNQAAGGIYELSLVDNGGETKSKVPILTAIDLQKFKKEVAVYELKAGPTSAVIRDIKLDLKLTDAMKAQALYAGVRKNSNSSPCDEARFRNELKGSINKTLPSPVTPPKSDCGTECKTKEEHEAEKSLADDYKDMLSDTNDVSKETIRSRLVEEYNKNAEKDLCKDVIVPYEFSFTVDGIGGFAFGQLVTCNLLPEKVKTTYVYQITAVEHSITYGDWTTTVNTVARYK